MLIFLRDFYCFIVTYDIAICFYPFSKQSNLLLRSLLYCGEAQTEQFVAEIIILLQWRKTRAICCWNHYFIAVKKELSNLLLICCLLVGLLSLSLSFFPINERLYSNYLLFSIASWCCLLFQAVIASYGFLLIYACAWSFFEASHLCHVRGWMYILKIDHTSWNSQNLTLGYYPCHFLLLVGLLDFPSLFGNELLVMHGPCCSWSPLAHIFCPLFQSALFDMTVPMQRG